MTHSFPTRRYSELKFVHELRPCNLDAGNKRNLAHVRLVDAPVPQRHIGTLHLVETDKVPERSKCLRTEHLEFIIVKDQGQLEPRKSEQQRSEEHTSELQSLMRISYAVFCLKKTNNKHVKTNKRSHTAYQNKSQRTSTIQNKIT